MVIIIAVAAGHYVIKTDSPTLDATPNGYKNITYTIDGSLVALVNGASTVSAAPGSASEITTQYFGNNASGDLNGDGISDVAFILTQNTGGSGTFYYVAVAIKTPNGFAGTNAVLLGDRIAPQTTEITDGELRVNYAERSPDEPMTAQPSVGVTKYLKVYNNTLQEIPIAGLGEHCGGNMTNAPQCATGLHCVPQADSHLPFGDVGGTCTAN